ncbi:MAG: nicotinate phosphoribosyltransferase [Chloroflexi bacterium]|jgi:nicotinate phosphoribosyltransferase|nr:nicotinate phosphoribosyltransferase [Candidatus Parcubacteria bacterium]MBT7082136.1 nicotinate phosphoribosyltransferase [Chloroflexota bacterium]
MKDRPIITSLMDIDFYKLTMGQLIFLMYPDVQTTFRFINRTKGVPLSHYVDIGELREQLQHVQTLRVNNTELHYLRGTNEYGERMFREPYLEFLRDMQLPDFELSTDSDGQLRIFFPGLWSTNTYWETLALSITSELWCRSQMKHLSRFERELIWAEGQKRLATKLAILTDPQNSSLTISDFGTRRRFSKEWQWYVVRTLAEELLPGQFLGTSNVQCAMDHGLLPMGTSAHELPMVLSGIMHGSDDEIRASSQKVLADWWEIYGHGLSIFLPDTYGTDFFFNDLTREQVENWKGFRHDSGDPIEFGEKVLRLYQRHGVDPLATGKFIVFSDGLDMNTIIQLHQHFRDRIRISFGWGTNLTNDMGLRTLSLVIKAYEACGHGLVKLSDNLDKATGLPDDIERFKAIFGHTTTYRQECLV